MTKNTPLPIHGERGLLIQDDKGKPTLIISDVHIGFEEELINDGIYIPNQTRDMIARIRSIAKDKGIERIIINGDLKHRVPKTQWKYRQKKLDDLNASEDEVQTDFDEQVKILTEKMKRATKEQRKVLQEEFEQLEKKKSSFYRQRRKQRYGILEKSEVELKNVSVFLRTLLDIGHVDIVPGNHDGRIEKEMGSGFLSLADDPNLHIAESSGMVIRNTGIFHGHAWPSEEVMAQEYLVMGHGHAAILLTDDLGVRNYEQCWLRARLTEKVHEKYLDAQGEVILMPSFNDFFRGSPVNRKGRLLGPLFKNDYVDVDNGNVFLLDGINLGKVKDLRRFAQTQGKRW